MAENMVNYNTGFLERQEIEALGFKELGENVLIHRSSVLIRCDGISIGDNVRIDPFCILSAGDGIIIGSHVHIASHCSLTGKAIIQLEDFSGLSQGVRIFSASDDYSGNFLTNPTVPEKFRRLQAAPVKIGRHVIVGSGTVILPDSILDEGVAVGAMALIKGHLQAWTIYAGTPARPLRERSKVMLDRESEFHG